MCKVWNFINFINFISFINCINFIKCSYKKTKAAVNKNPYVFLIKHSLFNKTTCFLSRRRSQWGWGTTKLNYKNPLRRYLPGFLEGPLQSHWQTLWQRLLQHPFGFLHRPPDTRKTPLTLNGEARTWIFPGL